MAKIGRRKGESEFTLALAAGATVRAAAKKAGVGERTAYRWVEDPAFRERVDAVRTAMFDRAVSRLAKGAAAAAETLQRLLKAEGESIRLGAARSVLELAFKAHDWADTVARIEELERKVGAQRSS